MQSKQASRSLGQKGEQWAQAYLLRKGYRIIATNYFNPLGRRLGEIDIVAQDRKTLVFVEVKTRLGEMGVTILPEENITRDKLRKLSKIAEHYLRTHNAFETPYRFDALALTYCPHEKRVAARHIENIFYS